MVYHDVDIRSDLLRLAITTAWHFNKLLALLKSLKVTHNVYQTHFVYFKCNNCHRTAFYLYMQPHELDKAIASYGGALQNEGVPSLWLNCSPYYVQNFKYSRFVHQDLILLNACSEQAFYFLCDKIQFPGWSNDLSYGVERLLVSYLVMESSDFLFTWLQVSECLIQSSEVLLDKIIIYIYQQYILLCQNSLWHEQHAHVLSGIYTHLTEEVEQRPS